MSQNMDFSRVAVVPELPAVFLSHQGEPFPDELTGATIVRIGTLEPRDAVEGGGLAIDYRKPDENDVKRIVFAFNELGMWVIHDGQGATTV